MGDSHQAKNLCPLQTHPACPGSGQWWQMTEDHSSGRMCGDFQARHLTVLQDLDLWCWILTTVGVHAGVSNMSSPPLLHFISGGEWLRENTHATDEMTEIGKLNDLLQTPEGREVAERGCA